MRKKLMQIIMDNKISMNEFTERIGYSHGTVYYWMSGRNKPTIDAVIKICTEFHVSADWLLGIKED